MRYVTKAKMEFSPSVVRHINWASFQGYLNTWGRLVFTRDFETLTVTVEAQATEDPKKEQAANDEDRYLPSEKLRYRAALRDEASWLESALDCTLALPEEWRDGFERRLALMREALREGV